MQLRSPPEFKVTIDLRLSYRNDRNMFTTEVAEGKVSFIITSGPTSIKKDFVLQGISSLDDLEKAWLARMNSWLPSLKQAIPHLANHTKSVVIELATGKAISCLVSYESELDNLASVKVNVEGISDLKHAPGAGLEKLQAIIDYTISHLGEAWPKMAV